MTLSCIRCIFGGSVSCGRLGKDLRPELEAMLALQVLAKLTELFDK
jgi:hypothetical protein